jgi:hypothetical protein
VSILTAVRERVFTPKATITRSGGPRPDADAEDAPPFAGYDRLSSRQVMDGLRRHSQLELGAVETYERSHQDRDSVLDKLRWMRGSEPLPSYDALSVEEIVAKLGEADLSTIKKVRGYERKFANRTAVLEEVVRVHHRRLEDKPASPAPTYQPLKIAPATGRRDAVPPG